jgi:hypothetical protein
VYLPTIGCGRVIWHLGYTTSKSVDAFAASYGEFRQAALAIDPSYQVEGILTDGFLSTRKSLKQLFHFALIANCMLHATFKLPGQIKGVAKAVREVCPPTHRVRQKLSGQFREIFFVQKARKTPNNRSLSQRLRRFVEQVTCLAGESNGGRVKRWIQRKKVGWYALNEDSAIPKTTTPVDQIHNAIDRKLFMMKGFHHENGSQLLFLNGLAILADGGTSIYRLRARRSHSGGTGSSSLSDGRADPTGGPKNGAHLTHPETIDKRDPSGGPKNGAHLTQTQHILMNLIPYQRRAINSGKCAIEVEGGKVPTRDWFLNLQILTSGGFQ